MGQSSVGHWGSLESHQRGDRSHEEAQECSVNAPRTTECSVHPRKLLLFLESATVVTALQTIK